MVGSGTQGTPNSCTNDWLLIGCAKVTDRIPIPNTCEDRICGGTFNAEVSTVDRTVQSKFFGRKILFFSRLKPTCSPEMQVAYARFDFRFTAI